MSNEPDRIGTTHSEPDHGWILTETVQPKGKEPEVIKAKVPSGFKPAPPAKSLKHRGWARSASGETSDGISWIEDGTRNYRATGAVLAMPYYLALKAEALHLADRTSEALEALNEAEALAERFEQSFWCAELHRLRGVFLAAMGTEETQIEASFCEAIRMAKKQKSISLEKRAEATYAEYRRQKASASGGRGFRLPLC
jgi:hypothetical protein